MDLTKRELFCVKYSWNDAISCLKEDRQNLFNLLPDKIKLEMMNKSEESVCKGLEGGLLSDWNFVMDIAVDGSGFFNILKGKKVIVAEPSEGDNWLKKFEGIVKDITTGAYIIEDNDGFSYIVDYEKVTFIVEESSEIPQQTSKSELKKFAVVAKAEYVRDAQVASSENDIKWDDKGGWWDFEGVVILSIEDAYEPSEAITSVAKAFSISEEILSYYELALPFKTID